MHEEVPRFAEKITFTKTFYKKLIINVKGNVNGENEVKF